ncbi:hypothetical protein [Desulfobulbus oligotrophicus]|uniref:Uncharacterized protein n=1 Tax=Desulfobulbus oligotrophicus TaxID=1909699 RepID=A0A7T5VB76_9BACT|nr:hypothetical protein [Desulfobulbus oligotrophicus]QQG64694.1 hypothetical protein HP555_01855 [Desulfobulbus oligotrophicus]
MTALTERYTRGKKSTRTIPYWPENSSIRAVATRSTSTGSLNWSHHLLSAYSLRSLVATICTPPLPNYLDCMRILRASFSSFALPTVFLCKTFYKRIVFNAQSY